MNSILLLALMFQFTHPGRGATVVLSEPTIAELVSIHAPREGCDRTAPRVGLWEKCFNSRTPGGVRPLLARRRTHSNGFQFTHPGRGATDGGRLGKQRRGVSIHAPREGCDLRLWYSLRTLRSFNSRTPGGVRRAVRLSVIAFCSCFNSRTPGGVRPTTYYATSSAGQAVSIHAPREGCDCPLARSLRYH